MSRIPFFLAQALVLPAFLLALAAGCGPDEEQKPDEQEQPNGEENGEENGDENDDENDEPNDEPPGDPSIRSFTITPAGPVMPGESVVLAWETRNALEVFITDSDRDPIDLRDEEPEAGSIDLVLEEIGEHTFRLAAVGAEGTDPAFTWRTVVVVDPDAPPVIVYFEVEPEEIQAEQQAYLSWSVDNASDVEIVDCDDEPLDLSELSSPAGGGFLTVSPEHTTLYTLTAMGTGGEAHAEVELVVIPGDPDEPGDPEDPEDP